MVLNIIQILIAAALITTILLQQRGSGIGGAFGGGSSESYYSKRGAEKFIFNSAIALSIAFLVVALLRHVL